MRFLSLSEFAEFCACRGRSCYIYSTQNQPDAEHDMLRFTMRFNSIIINLKPDRICFKNDCDSLNIEQVKDVVVYDDRPCIGTIFKVRAGDSVYTWLMD